MVNTPLIGPTPFEKQVKTESFRTKTANRTDKKQVNPHMVNSFTNHPRPRHPPTATPNKLVDIGPAKNLPYLSLTVVAPLPLHVHVSIVTIGMSVDTLWTVPAVLRLPTPGTPTLTKTKLGPHRLQNTTVLTLLRVRISPHTPLSTVLTKLQPSRQLLVIRTATLRREASPPLPTEVGASPLLYPTLLPVETQGNAKANAALALTPDRIVTPFFNPLITTPSTESFSFAFRIRPPVTTK